MYPSYRSNLITKTVLNILNFVAALLWFPGFMAHVTFKDELLTEDQASGIDTEEDTESEEDNIVIF